MYKSMQQYVHITYACVSHISSYVFQKNTPCDCTWCSTVTFHENECGMQFSRTFILRMQLYHCIRFQLRMYEPLHPTIIECKSWVKYHFKIHKFRHILIIYFNLQYNDILFIGSRIILSGFATQIARARCSTKKNLYFTQILRWILWWFRSL